MNDIMNMKPLLDAIRARHPEFWRSENAYREAAALWGSELDIFPLNKVGGFINYETEVFEAGRCNGEIRPAPAPNGLWVMATSYWYGSGGGGYAPSIWSDTAYRHRDAAYKAGIEKLIDKFTTLREQTADSRRIIKILEAAKHPQLSLL